MTFLLPTYRTNFTEGAFAGLALFVYIIKFHVIDMDLDITNTFF